MTRAPVLSSEGTCEMPCGRKPAMFFSLPILITGNLRVSVILARILKFASKTAGHYPVNTGNGNFTGNFTGNTAGYFPLPGNSGVIGAADQRLVGGRKLLGGS